MNRGTEEESDKLHSRASLLGVSGANGTCSAVSCSAAASDVRAIVYASLLATRPIESRRSLSQAYDEYAAECAYENAPLATHRGGPLSPTPINTHRGPVPFLEHVAGFSHFNDSLNSNGHPERTHKRARSQDVSASEVKLGQRTPVPPASIKRKAAHAGKPSLSGYAESLTDVTLDLKNNLNCDSNHCEGTRKRTRPQVSIDNVEATYLMAPGSPDGRSTSARPRPTNFSQTFFSPPGSPGSCADLL